MSDQNTTLAELRTVVRQFVDARDWQQFHSPKNLSMALAIEAAGDALQQPSQDRAGTLGVLLEAARRTDWPRPAGAPFCEMRW